MLCLLWKWGTHIKELVKTSEYLSLILALLQRGCVIFVLYRIHLPLTFDLCCGLNFQTFGLLCEFCVWCRIWFLICFWQGLASSVTQYFVRNPLISVTDLKLSPRLRSDFTLSPLYCFVATPCSISYHCWCTKNQQRKMLHTSPKDLLPHLIGAMYIHRRWLLHESEHSIEIIY